MNSPTKLVLASRPQWIGMGAVTVTSALSSATVALSNFLTSTGCVTTPFDQCSAFQTAYNNAGGGNQTLVVDGYYGPATQSALQEVFDQMGGGSAPAACVPGHSTSSSGTTSASLAPLPGSSSSTTMNIFGQQIPTSTVILAAGVAAALGLVGAALYKTHTDKRSLRYITRRPPRRRRRTRRVRRKGRRR
jgi:hypothetical protein